MDAVFGNRVDPAGGGAMTDDVADDSVWVTRPTESLLELSFTRDIPTDADREAWFDLVHATRHGHHCAPELFPDRLWLEDARHDRKSPPAYFRTLAGAHIVRGDFAEVLRGFDFGENQLIPVTLLKSDRETPVDGAFYFMPICEKKSVFEPKLSGRYKPAPLPDSSWVGTLKGVPKDGDVMVNRSALSGPDIWTDDDFFMSVFLKGRLYKALRDRSLIPDQIDVVECVVADAPGAGDAGVSA